MTKENFEKLKKHIDEVLLFTKDNVHNKTLELSSLYNDIVKLHIKEKRNLNVININKDKLYGELYHEYKFKFEYELDTKHEIETYIFADPKFHKKRLEIQEQLMITSYLESTLDNIKNTSFQIKAFVDLLKIHQGL